MPISIQSILLYICKHIGKQEDIRSWKAETCNQVHHTPLIATTCTVIMHSDYNNGDLHEACQGRVHMQGLSLSLSLIMGSTSPSIVLCTDMQP